MSELLEGFDGALIGAAALVFSGLIVESYKYHRNRRAAASAIAGEIFTIMQMTARRRHVAFFTRLKSQLEAGDDVKIPNIVGSGLTGQLDPVIEAHLTQLGFLATNRMPERIVQFYTNLYQSLTEMNLGDSFFERGMIH